MLAFGIVAMMGLAMTGCDSGGDDSSVDPALVGVWHVTSLQTTGGNIISDGSGGSVTLDLRADGTYTSTEVSAETNKTENGTWEVSGNQFHRTTEGITEDIEFTLTGNTLEFRYTDFYGQGPATMVLQR